MAKKISKETKISEIIKEKPEAIEILINSGMGCIGCPMAQQENLEQGCLAHGLSKKEIKKIIDKINEV